ncbi:hypothetical protein BT96DRAFT_85299 [Gymnopus androsaceus JB14]|uniref:Uncharacterized protein n=1 Tax=Gymnopus androsaceus JB14 TaxID=1447944 RepID=A0A6A4IEV2_9AGAR|nr:hypothetical protein BT96DRAFT_85299 [Gymnopus androsaceus JB14]
MVVTQEANQAKVVKEMEAVGEQLKEWISNRESNLHRRREREEKEKNEREAKEKETKERLAREAEEKERARIETHSTSSVTPAAATTTSDPTPDFLMGIYRAIQTHDPSGRVLKQLMEGTNKEIDPDEQKGQGSRVAEREQERPKKAEEEERRRLEEESRKKAEVDAETRRRLAVAAGEEQKRKAEVAEAQRKRKMLEERKKAKLDEELAAQANARAEEEARKRVLDEQQRREALQKQKLQATGSPNINTNVAKRLPVALVDSPVIPPIATISAGASSTSQSPTTPLSLPPPIWQPLPPKPQSAITTNVIAKQALVPPSEVQEQKLTKKQRAKARKLEQQQSARVGAVSGNVSLSLSTSAVVENDAQDQAALGVRLKKTNPHSPAGTNFALGMVLELNDRASTSSSVDAPLLHSSSSHSTGNLAINPKPGPSPTSPMAYASNVRFVTGAKQQVDQSTQDSVGNDGPKIKVEEEETRPLSLPTQSTPIAPVSPLVSIAPSTVQVARTVPSAAPSLTASVAESSSQLPQKKLPKRKLPDFTKDSLTSRSGAAAPPKQPSKDPTSATVAPPTTTAIATPPPQFRRTADSVASPAVLLQEVLQSRSFLRSRVSSQLLSLCPPQHQAPRLLLNDQPKTQL